MLIKDKFYIDNKIYCEVYIPKKNYPLVIYSHSLGMSHKSGYEYFNHLLKRGIGCVTFDFRGGGYSSKSKGKTTEMSLISERDDILSVVEYVKDLDFIDCEKIILLGTSQGAAASTLAASKIPNDILGLIILYPALLIPDVAHEQYTSIEEIPDYQLFNGWIEVGKCYFEDVWTLDIFSEISKFKKPVLIIHGDADYIVDVNYSIEADKHYLNSELKIIANGGHGFRGDKFEECIEYINQYLDKIL